MVGMGRVALAPSHLTTVGPARSANQHLVHLEGAGAPGGGGSGSAAELKSQQQFQSRKRITPQTPNAHTVLHSRTGRPSSPRGEIPEQRRWPGGPRTPLPTMHPDHPAAVFKSLNCPSPFLKINRSLEVKCFLFYFFLFWHTGELLHSLCCRQINVT